MEMSINYIFLKLVISTLWKTMMSKGSHFNLAKRILITLLQSND